MRPEDFSPGNAWCLYLWAIDRMWASMRPEDFSPGNPLTRGPITSRHNEASMRPEDFSPGNPEPGRMIRPMSKKASMRPEEFSPGNHERRTTPLPGGLCFNEAGGFLPRKRRRPRQSRAGEPDQRLQ